VGDVDIDMRKDNTLIFLDLQLVPHFIDGTGIGSSTTDINATTFLVLELEFFLRPTVSRPVHLGIGPPFGTLD
jgi:hypothetical protein